MIIEVDDLKKNYKSYERGNTWKETVKSLFVRKTVLVEALKGISFTMGKGELTALLGPNGAGKSTTLKILTGVLYPTSGRVRVMDRVPWKDRKSYVAKIGAVFGQKSQLIWDIPPVDSFYLNKAIYSIPEVRFKRNLEDLVEMLQVGSVVKKPTRLLSLGERMKCEFIMAMLHEPEVVFLDEPTIGLDVIARDTIRKFILKMNQNGTTFILTTHDLGDVEHLARRVIVVNRGEIVFDDAFQGLKRYTGNKKIIRLTTREPVLFSDGQGITVKNQISPYESLMELDTAETGLNEFMQKIHAESAIADMSVADVPIEDIIKQLYAKQA